MTTTESTTAELFRLYLITDDSGRTPRDLVAVVEAAIAGGVTAVQFREKSLGGNLCYNAYREVHRACSAGGVPLMINADLLPRFEGRKIEYDGVQYGNRTAPRRMPKRCLSGYSAHAVTEAADAARRGANFVMLSPIFDTPSKKGLLPAMGHAPLVAARQALPDTPILALGGISPATAAEAIRSGASGVAMIRAIMAAEDPKSVAETLLRVVQNAAA